MKIVFTLFIFLTFCFKLSAAVPGIDTPKTSSINRRRADVKVLVPDTSKTQRIVNQATDNVISNLVAKKTDSTKSTLIASQPELSLKTIVTPPKDSSDYSEPYFTDNLKRVTSLIQLDSLRSTIIAEQARQDRLKKLILQNEQIKIAALIKINNLDSLKEELKVTSSDTLKALLYTRIALKYLDYDTISNTEKQEHYQNAAINYTLLAIHDYASYNDSTGLRDAYANLAKVYYSQKKYTQAKWFILQSNTLSRAKNDTPNIISSLLTLASIKSDIKDYTLAMGDLDEALQLSITNHTPKTELEVLKNYAFLYNTLQNYPKEALILKKRDSLLDSMQKSDEAQLAREATLKKKLDLANKKKLLLASTRKPSKSNSAVKMASL
jgi:tetratricopeptide (TPR) repeat protein